MKMPIEDLKHYSEKQPGEKFSEYLNRITPDRIEGMSNQDHAWCLLRGELEPEKWTTGEAANYHGFFNHGWDAATRASDEVIRGLVEALDNVLNCISETRGENADNAVFEGREALAKARQHLSNTHP